MKTFTAALIAAALIVPSLGAAPAMAQSQRHDDRGGASQSHDKRGPKVVTKKVVTKKATYKSFRKGERFDRSRARNYQQVDHRKFRNVKAPPRGYQYVRSGDDLLLVGTTSGIIAAVTAGLFR